MPAGSAGWNRSTIHPSSCSSSARTLSLGANLFAFSPGGKEITILNGSEPLAIRLAATVAAGRIVASNARAQRVGLRDPQVVISRDGDVDGVTDNASKLLRCTLGPFILPFEVCAERNVVPGLTNQAESKPPQASYSGTACSCAPSARWIARSCTLI